MYYVDKRQDDGSRADITYRYQLNLTQFSNVRRTRASKNRMDKNVLRKGRRIIKWQVARDLRPIGARRACRFSGISAPSHCISLSTIPMIGCPKSVCHAPPLHGKTY